MALSKQIHIYSVDTCAFFSKKELSVYNKINDLQKEKKKLKKNKACTQEDIKELNAQIKDTKEYFYSILSQNKEVRVLDPISLNKHNVVSIFDSMLTRTLNMEQNNLYDDLIIVRTYYFDVLHSIITNGFLCNGEKYICFTASAGQIRTKKTVFIREKILIEHQNTLMCGLTLDKINSLGGVNVNKYLAYLALCNSATDVWREFNITKSIVVDDMETLVSGVVDFIDDKTCKITRQLMDIPITHTDGCGMVLPKISRKNFMVRLPWIKGLLTSFPFDKFIAMANQKDILVNHGIITDIYGKQHDVIAEGIEVIFTKSQFKMYKYYKSWDDYLEKYIKHGCTAGKCNEEENEFPFAKLNYQMLQTLTDLSDEELEYIASRSKKHIKEIASDRKTMLKIFGVTEYNKNKTNLQQALEIYPELLSDIYTKNILCQIKKKLVYEARSAKLDVNGKYTFIVPDLYAFCEFLFLKDKNPKGLLQNNEVYCRLFSKYEKLDCLRSPHLYREHAVRKNVVNSNTNIGEWFGTKALYTSCHDLISKVLQFDNDGDKSLVCADEVIVGAAERNLKDIVPLYYNMKKAEPVIVDNEKIYNGLIAAYTGGNIGQISNDITKIWNSDNIDIDAIKIQCMMNNYVIDYAKTLYKPVIPNEIKNNISLHTKLKVPHFFIYAKDKSKKQVEDINNSVVNKLESIIPNKRIVFTAKNTGKFDYKNLMSNSSVEINENIIQKYNELNTQNHFLINSTEDDYTNLQYIYQDIRKSILSINPDEKYITDVLVKYLYKTKNSKHKETLWLSFGDIIVDNLKNNININYILCDKCGKRILKSSNNLKLCDECSLYKPVEHKIVTCMDCGETFEIGGKSRQFLRCNKCYNAYRRKYNTNKDIERYRNKKAISCS
jgi:hypothetical protein